MRSYKKNKTPRQTKVLNIALCSVYNGAMGAIIMTDEKLYFEYENLIFSIAKEVAESFHCMKYDENGLTEYSHQLLEDLKSEGTLEFFRLLKLKEYDESKGEFSTYIYPHIKGVMRRYLETNMGVMALSKNSMDLVRKVQYEYYSLGKSADEIAANNDLSPETVNRCINYNTHYYSVSDVVPEDYEDNPYDYLNIADNQAADKIAVKNICIELLEDMFQSLSEKDRAILGHAFGVFGYEKKTLDEIAFEEMMKIDGVEKAKNAALERLKKKYPGSKLKDWKDVYRAVLYENNI